MLTINGVLQTEGVTPSGSVASMISTKPTQTVTGVSVSGGVFNGGFENAPAFTAATGANNWIDGTAAGSASNDSYGWAVINGTVAAAIEVSFDTTVSHSGRNSIKINATNNTGTAVVGNYLAAPTAISNKWLTPLKANTVYKASVWVKTNNVAANAVYADFREYNNAATLLATNTTTVKLSGTNDWTLLSVTFTSNASSTLMSILLRSVAGNIQTAWFDDITLEEIQSPTTSLTVPTPLSLTMQGVTSVAGIDNSLDSAGAYANTYAIPVAIDEGATHRQTYTPTRKYTTSIGVWVVEKGTGNWTLTVHTAANAVVASAQILNANLTNGQMNYFNVPNIWLTGALHFHVVSSVNDGTLKANTSNDLETGSFIQRFGAPTEDMKATANGVTTLVRADGDGILNGAVLDIDNGKYKYNSSYGTIADPNFIYVNDIYSATIGNRATLPLVLNDWGYSTVNLKADSGAQSVVWKVNTLLPINHLNIKTVSTITAAAAKTWSVSSDNVNYTVIDTLTGTDLTNYNGNVETDLMNGKTVFYIKFTSAAGAISQLYSLTIDATVDTSSLPVGMIYPLGINQFSESYDLPTTATRLYFNLAKYTNTNGVVMPAFAYSDSSGNLIGYPIFSPIDNSGETNPAMNVILASTTSAQAVGTGSANGTTGYILNDGEYMTLTGATAMGTLTYQVGFGTTTFSNITKNRVYVSSNGQAITTTNDQSLQANIQYGIRTQGEIENNNLFENELNLLQNKLANAESTGRITVGTGTTTVIENYGYSDLIIGVPSTALAVGVDLGSALVRKVKSVTIVDESGACGTNNITISTQGAELINGAATFVMNTNYQSVTLYNNGINWFIS